MESQVETVGQAAALRLSKHKAVALEHPVKVITGVQELTLHRM
jgi:hypothetical protein